MNEQLPVFQEGDIVCYTERHVQNFPHDRDIRRRRRFIVVEARPNGDEARVIIRYIKGCGTYMWRCWRGHLKLAVADSLVESFRENEVQGG